MIKEIVDRFFEKREEIKAVFTAEHPDEYGDIVTTVVKILDLEELDHERVHEIDDGDYQGTLLYVIAAKGYQPRDYHFVKVGYGSCSGCDTLQGIKDYGDEKPTPEQVEQYMALATHIIQGLKLMGGDGDINID